MLTMLAALAATTVAGGDFAVNFPPGKEERFTVDVGGSTWFANEPVWFQVKRHTSWNLACFIPSQPLAALMAPLASS